jgi:hypothetical protein
MSRYRCYLTAKEEKKLPEKVRKELSFLRKRLKDSEDWANYNIHCRFGDPVPERLEKKFGST